METKILGTIQDKFCPFGNISQIWSLPTSSTIIILIHAVVFPDYKITIASNLIGLLISTLRLYSSLPLREVRVYWYSIITVTNYHKHSDLINADVSCYSSVNQKSNLSLAGLKSRCGIVAFPFGGTSEESTSFSPIFTGCSYSGACDLSSSFSKPELMDWVLLTSPHSDLVYRLLPSSRTTEKKKNNKIISLF